MNKVKKKGLALFIAFTLLIMQCSIITWAQVPDVMNSWAKNDIMEWVDKGWARCYEDGNFKPNQDITRAEFIEILNNAFNIPKQAAKLEFSDVDEADWFYKHVAYAKNAGYIDGYPNGTFKPNGFITRQEASKIIATMLHMDDYYKRVDDKFKDSNQQGLWAKDSVNGLVGYEIIKGYPNGNFGYNNNITRAEALVILKRAHNVVSHFTGVQALVSHGKEIVKEAKVSLYDETGKTIATAVTNQSGIAKFEAIKEGKYYLVSSSNALAASTAVEIRNGFTTLVNVHIGEAVEVKGTLVDQRNKVAAQGVNLIFKEGNFVATTLKDGTFKCALVPNATYEVYVAHEGLKNIGKIQVGKEALDLGILKADFIFDKADTSAGSSSGGNNNGNTGSDNNAGGNDSEDSKEDKTAPVIAINTASLSYSEEMKAYVIDEKLESLTGTITDDSEIKSITYNITVGNLEICSENIAPSKAWEIKNIPLLIGKNKLTITATDSASNVGTASIDLYSTSMENLEKVKLDENDDDNDGLLNYQEDYYKTDKTKPDTDGDGLTDLQELIITMTDPLKADTDDNGITDDQEDFDQDGVKNIDEIKHNADPYNADSDFDGLKDNEEIARGTKADEMDTDNDGLNDSKELELGTDPLNPDTNGNGILDGDELFNITHTVANEEADPNVIPTINIDLPGELVETLHISKLAEDNMYLPSEMPGYLGAGYEFELGGTFDTPATLTYTFNSEFVNREDFNPAIYYCDTENQEMVLLENQVIDLEKCTVTAPVTHFSKYILIDKTQFDKVFEVEIKGPSEQENINRPLDIVFAMDSSGSMSWNDPQNVRLQVAKRFVDALGENDRTAIIDFDYSAYTLCNLTSDKEKVKAAIDTIDSSGGTSLTAGIKKALEQFTLSAVSMFSQLFGGSEEAVISGEENGTNGLSQSGALREEAAIGLTTDSALQVSFAAPKEESRDALKYIILLTDGRGTYNKNLTTQAIQNDVVIYTVSLGSDIDESLLREIAAQTGGKYYNADVADDLIKEFENMTHEMVDITKDSDNDGLSDYHEERLRWFNGITIKTDPNNPDTDGDGVLDGDEVKVVVDEKNNVHYYTMYSNPTLADTDGDGLSDGREIRTFADGDNDSIADAVDPEKLVYNITDRTLGLAAGFAYSNVEQYKNRRISEILNVAKLDGISKKHLAEIKDFKILESSDSGTGKIGDKNGLGYVAIQLVRDKQSLGRKNVIIVAFRGSEFDDDAVNDIWANTVALSAGKYASQSDNAYKVYKALVKKYPNNDFYVTGHSLGGKITQDVLMQLYEENNKLFAANIKEPYKSATFNGYGYRKGNNYLQGDNFIEANRLGKLKEYYKYGRLYNYTMKGDFVGQYLGPIKLGTNKESFIAHDENGKIIDISNQSVLWYGKGTSVSTVHGINLFHINKDFVYKGKDSKINIYEVQFIGK